MVTMSRLAVIFVCVYSVLLSLLKLLLETADKTLRLSK